MGLTPRYQFPYLDRGEPLYLFRAKSQTLSENLERGLTVVQARANDLIALLPAGQTVIALDTDGTPYFDPAGTVANPVPMGLDVDGVPYFLPTDPTGAF